VYEGMGTLLVNMAIRRKLKLKTHIGNILSGSQEGMYLIIAPYA
jgi:hypothetical protein